MRTIASAFWVLLVCSPLSAQVRTWVSTNGLDTNDCSRTSPCRNFDDAVAAVASGGEVVVLDSGGYGPATVTKAASLISPEGIHAAIAPTSGRAISVDAGSGVVVLRGLYLNSQGANVGVELISARSLYLENLVVARFSVGIGLAVTTGATYCLITDTVVRNGTNGLEAQHTGTVDTLDVIVERSRFVDNAGQSVFLMGGTRSLLRDTQVDGNTFGILVEASSTRTAEATIERCSVSENLAKGISVSVTGAPTSKANISNSIIHANQSVGVEGSGPNARVWIANSTITRNNIGVQQASGAAMLSLQNNTIYGNRTAEVAGTLGNQSPN